MKRLLLAALFGVSFALHDWSHAHVSGPRDEFCAVSVSPAAVPEPEPEVVVLARESFELPASAVVVTGFVASRASPSRAPPSALLS